jgi:N-acetylmuramoyl-L-alanine amidase
MATTTTNPDIEITHSPDNPGSSWPRDRGGDSLLAKHSAVDEEKPSPSPRDALQALIAFSALHEQVRRRKALAVKQRNFDGSVTVAEFEPEFKQPDQRQPEFEQQEQFVLDEVLQMVAERAVAITGADGIAIALAENNEIVLRAAAGTVRPDLGARIDRDSAFSGACFKSAQIIQCDDTETDTRVNLDACRKLGARSMVAVPLCGRRRVIGLLEAFSSWPFGFNDSDTGSLTLLAELVVSALKPEDEDRFAQSAQIAETRLERERSATVATPKIAAPPTVPAPIVPAPSVAQQSVAPKSSPQSSVAPPTIQSNVPSQPVTEPAKTVPPKPVLAEPAASSVSTTQPAPVAIPPAKPVEEKAVLPLSPAIIEAPAPEPLKPAEKTSETTPLESPIPSAEITSEPLLMFGQTEPQTEPAEEKSHTAIIVLVVSIVVAAAFAGGVWWKLKTALNGSAMITTQTREAQTEQPQSGNASQKKSAPAAGTAKDLTTPPVPGVPSANSTVSGQENSGADADESSPSSGQDVSKFPRVTGVRHWSSADSSTVVLDLEDQVQYEEHQLSNPDRYYYDLRDTQLAPELAGKTIDVGDTFLTRIRIAQPVAGMTRVVLETKAGANLAHPGVSLEPSPYRLVIQVRKAGTTPTGAVNLFPNAQADKKKLAIVIPPPTKDDLQLRAHVAKMRIVVDAGHGGWDLGTVGRRGLLEKDLVLEIAQRLGKLLESRLGADVILTRNDDNYIPLDERAEIANQAQADLFVSVHANYSDLPSARGVETYYTNFFSAPGSKENGSKENGSKDVTTAAAKNSPTLSAADLHERIEQSRRLAASVQRSLYGTLSAENPGLRDRGVKEAGFVVLTESAMPGILAEVSFVSSPTDEQKLRSDTYREEIAEALYKGIAHYAASSPKSVKVASAK